MNIGLMPISCSRIHPGPNLRLPECGHHSISLYHLLEPTYSDTSSFGLPSFARIILLIVHTSRLGEVSDRFFFLHIHNSFHTNTQRLLTLPSNNNQSIRLIYIYIYIHYLPLYIIIYQSTCSIML